MIWIRRDKNTIIATPVTIATAETEYEDKEQLQQRLQGVESQRSCVKNVGFSYLF